MKIYLVTGETGEYDEWRTWIVCAYTDIDSAIKHSTEANLESSRIMQLKQDRRERISVYPDEVNKEYRNKYDNNMNMDYTGTSYTVEETELFNLFKYE